MLLISLVQFCRWDLISNFFLSMLFQGVLGVGDDEGNIHLYDLGEAVKTSATSSVSLLPASRVSVASAK